MKVAHDGSRIETQNIGRNQSERAGKEIENEFYLVKASSKKTTAIRPFETCYGWWYSDVLEMGGKGKEIDA
ncbi:MAG: hypothetical protein ABIN80_14330 [Dyadobacter sp.]|uniref:hypothetical protein n=1 Tax=Dyadobacter sp. TaxID=1914288 RepID=UPI003267576F